MGRHTICTKTMFTLFVLANFIISVYSEYSEYYEILNGKKLVSNSVIPFASADYMRCHLSCFKQGLTLAMSYNRPTKQCYCNHKNYSEATTLYPETNSDFISARLVITHFMLLIHHT